MKLTSIKILGAIGILGAPWQFIDFISNGLYDRFVTTSVSGIRGLVFMVGWISSVIGLYKIKAMGNKPWQRNILVIQISLLVLAAIWCVYEIFDPTSPSPIYFWLNFSWPLSGFFMVITGIIIIRAKKLKGWKLYMPLLAGLWFPQTILIYLISLNSIGLIIFSGIYATIVFSLLGFSLIVNNYEHIVKKPAIYNRSI
jgi:hypothetical protein